jgi:hypothetical protein
LSDKRAHLPQGLKRLVIVNVLKMSENIDAIIKMTDIALSIQGALTAAVNQFSGALNTLQRMIP